MGPKGKSKKQFAQHKSAAQTGMQVAKASNTQNRTIALTLEIENLSAQHELKVSELETHKHDLSVQYELKVSELETRKHEYNFLLQKISRLCSDIEAKKAIIANNSSMLSKLESQIINQNSRIAHKKKLTRLIVLWILNVTVSSHPYFQLVTRLQKREN